MTNAAVKRSTHSIKDISMRLWDTTLVFNAHSTGEFRLVTSRGWNIMNVTPPSISPRVSRATGWQHIKHFLQDGKIISGWRRNNSEEPNGVEWPLIEGRIIKNSEKFHHMKHESILAHCRYPYRGLFSPEMSDYATLRRFEFRYYIFTHGIFPRTCELVFGGKFFNRSTPRRDLAAAQSFERPRMCVLTTITGLNSPVHVQKN